MPPAIVNVPTARPAPVRRKQHPFRWLALVVLVLVASLAIPEVFQAALRLALEFAAWRRGGDVRIERIDGAVWEPVVFTHAYLTTESAAGGTTRVEIARADVSFSWTSLFKRESDGWLRRVSLRGVSGKVEIPLDHEPLPEAPHSWAQWLGQGGAGDLPLPEAIDAQQVDFVFQSGADYVRVEDANFSASTTEAGELSIGKVTINQPWLRRIFRNVHGKSGLQDGRLVLADVALEPGVKLRSLSAAAAPLARGELDLEADFAAFDGTLRVEAETQPVGRTMVFEAGGNFGQINIAKLANFLTGSEAAGGTIKDGKFTFRGPPRDLARAQASLRFDAINFQWETRQWDSLTLGLVLMDRRLQLPQLDLRQGKNELHLTGELALPGPDQKWWQGDFNTTVDARIENLTELSALLLPEFKYAAGRAAVEGSIRGRGEEFNGQLLISGSKITWRNAPIETLHAAVKLSGKEVQVANVELVNGDDYLRGRGLVKLAQPAVYWGELRVVVGDLATYAAFLQKPVLPEPLAGGAIVDWTGEGSREGHSGKFLARLRKVRTLGAMAQQLHPIDADLQATYGSDTMQFSRFALSDDDSNFTANVAVGGKALHLQGMRFVHRGAVQLEGDALLPLDVWQKWPDVAPAQMLSEDVVSHVQLTARQLDLAAAAELSGWKFPIAGIVKGTLAADGPIKGLKLGGELTLEKARIPLGWTGDLLDAVSAQFAFHDNALSVQKFTSRHRFGDVALSGEVQFGDLLNPQLQLALRSANAALPMFAPAPLSLQASLDLAVTGPLSAATVKGTVTPRQLTLAATPDVSDLWKGGPVTIAQPFAFSAAPWSTWKFDIAAPAVSGLPIVPGGSADGELRLTGIGARPVVSGRFEAHEVACLSSQGGPLQLTNGSIQFSADPAAPTVLDLQFTGQKEGAAFAAGIGGPANQPTRTYKGTDPLTDAAVQALFALPPPAKASAAAPQANAAAQSPAPAPATPAATPAPSAAK